MVKLAKVRLVVGKDRVREDGVGNFLRTLGLEVRDLMSLPPEEAEKIFGAIGLSPPGNGLLSIMVELSTSHPEVSDVLDEGVKNLGGEKHGDFLSSITSKPQPQAPKPERQPPESNPTRRGTKIGDVVPKT